MERACLFPLWATWAGEAVGSREGGPVELEWEGSSYLGGDLIGPTERGGSERLGLMGVRLMPGGCPYRSPVFLVRGLNVWPPAVLAALTCCLPGWVV